MNNRNFVFTAYETETKYKNLKRKVISVDPKTDKQLITKKNMNDMYDALLKKGYSYRDISMTCVDTNGLFFNIKSYYDKVIDYDDDYGKDRVADPKKFDVATKLQIHIKI